MAIEAVNADVRLAGFALHFFLLSICHVTNKGIDMTVMDQAS